MILTITVRSSLHVSAPPHSDSTAPRAPPGLSAPQAGATLLSTMAGPFGEPLTALRPIRFGSKVAVRGRVHRVCWPVPPCAAGQGVGRLRDRAGRCTVQRCALRRRGRRVLRHLAGWHAAPRETPQVHCLSRSYVDGGQPASGMVQSRVTLSAVNIRTFVRRNCCGVIMLRLEPLGTSRRKVLPWPGLF